MWRVALSDDRPFWCRAGDAATQFSPPIERGTVFVSVGVPVWRAEPVAILKAFGEFAARVGHPALTTKEIGKDGGVEVVLARLRGMDAALLASEWENKVGGVILSRRQPLVSEEALEMGTDGGGGRLEGGEMVEWHGIRFYRQRRDESPCLDTHVVSVTVFGTEASYRRPSRYAHGLLHLADAVQRVLPGFRLRVYFDRSLLPPAQDAAIARAKGPGKSERDKEVAVEGKEAWEYTLRELSTHRHVDLVRFECPSCLATPEGEHTELFGCFLRFVPLFTESGGWAFGPRSGRVVYSSDADFKGTPMELVGLQLAARVAAACDRGEVGVPELVGGAFGGSTAPRHWPYTGLPPIMAGQLMTTARFPSEWLAEFLDDCFLGRGRSVLGGRYARELHDPRSRVEPSYSRRKAVEQRSCFPYGTDEAFLTSHLVIHALNRAQSSAWLFWDFPIAVARGVLKTMGKHAEEAERAQRTPRSSELARSVMGALAVLAGTQAGNEVPLSVDDWGAAVGKWWDSPRLEWSEPAEKLPGSPRALGPEAAAITDDFARALTICIDLLLSGAAHHTTNDLLYLVQFRKMIAEGLAIGGVRSTTVRIGNGVVAWDSASVDDEAWAVPSWRAIEAEETPRVPRPFVPWASRFGIPRVGDLDLLHMLLVVSFLDSFSLALSDGETAAEVVASRRRHQERKERVAAEVAAMLLRAPLPSDPRLRDALILRLAGRKT
jgi:hypothetical protein